VRYQVLPLKGKQGDPWSWWTRRRVTMGVRRRVTMGVRRGVRWGVRKVEGRGEGAA